jgi:hypothetical protein
MKTHILSLSLFLGTVMAQAQFSPADVRYWVGSGQDSSVLVIDFQDGNLDGQSFAWGYLHDGTATGETMINAIAAADANLEVTITTGFLNDIAYGVHAGLGGDPNYWSTWSGTGIADMTMNSGISESLSNGEWLGCSYTDFDPALPPTDPIAAFDPLAFTAADVLFWTGTGSHSAMLVIDFQDGSATPSYAWGVRFEGSTTGEAMLNAVLGSDPALEAVITTGFLSDVTYGSHAGIGGSPDWWSTWSGTDLGNWSSNLGLSTAVPDGGFFGCSYTDFDPALRPTPPVAAAIPTHIGDQVADHMEVFPQPANEMLYIRNGDHSTQPIVITDLSGRQVLTARGQGLLHTVDVSSLSAGMYVLRMGGMERTIVVQ